MTIQTLDQKTEKAREIAMAKGITEVFEFKVDGYINEAGVKTYVVCRFQGIDPSFFEGETPYQAIGNLCDDIERQRLESEKVTDLRYHLKKK